MWRKGEIKNTQSSAGTDQFSGDADSLNKWPRTGCSMDQGVSMQGAMEEVMKMGEKTCTDEMMLFR